MRYYKNWFISFDFQTNGPFSFIGAAFNHLQMAYVK